MIPLFFNRILRSVKIDPEVFNEVQKDKNATLSAAIVVVLSSTAAGIGAVSLGSTNFILAFNANLNYLLKFIINVLTYII